jgi:hypothetical protein
MKILSLVLFVGIFFFSFTIAGKAQEISGKVKLEDNPSSWNYTVTMSLNGKSTQRYRTVDYYVFSTPEDAIVTLHFKAPYYGLQTKKNINVGKGYEMEPVTLLRMGDLLAQGKADGLFSDTQEYYETTGDYDGAAYILLEIRVEVERLPNSAALKGRVDTNFTHLKNYMKKVNQPITEKQVLRWKHYEQVIIINQTQKVNQFSPAEQRNYLNLIQDNEVPNDIRFEAVKAFSSSTLAPEVKQDALTYFRQQAANSKSALLKHSLFGLAKLGTPEDRIFIINYAKGKDFENSVTAISIIGDTQMIEARETLRDIATDSSKNIIVSQLAFRSLNIFANKLKDPRSTIVLQTIPVQTRTRLEVQKQIITRPQ